MEIIEFTSTGNIGRKSNVIAMRQPKLIGPDEALLRKYVSIYTISGPILIPKC